MRERRGWSANPSFVMEFLSKNVMPGRTKLPRIIHVKPYNPDLNDDEGEKENIDNTMSSPLRASPAMEFPMAVRARSLERLPGRDTGPSELGIISGKRSFDLKPRRSLGTPELAPVFITTTNNSFTITNNTLTTTNDFEEQKSPVKRRANW